MNRTSTPAQRELPEMNAAGNGREQAIWRDRVGPAAMNMGLVLLSAVYSLGMLYTGSAEYTVRYFLPFLWLVVIGARLVGETMAGGTRGRWVPEDWAVGGALLLAVATLLVGEELRWIDLPQYSMGGISGFVALSLLFLVAMALHARASAIRTGSRLFGWFVGIPFALSVTRFYPGAVPTSLLVPLQLPAFGNRFQSLTVLEVVFLLVSWWMISTWLELVWLWLESRRGKNPVAWGERISVGALSCLAAALPLSIGWIMIFPHYLGRIQEILPWWATRWVGRMIYNPIEFCLASGVGVLLAMGLAFWVAWQACLENHRRLIRLSAWFGFGIVILVLSEGILSAMKLQWFLAAMTAAILAADFAGSRFFRPLDADGGAETAIARALVSFPRSPIRFWGAGRRRWVLRAVPSLLLVLVPAVCLGSVLIHYNAILGRHVTLFDIFFQSTYRAAFYYMTVFCYLLAGIGVPLLILVPLRVAARFEKVWNPETLGELALTRLSIWEILVGVVLSPIRGLLILCGASLAGIAFWSLVMVESLIWIGQILQYFREEWPSLILFMGAVLVGLVPFIVTGLSRRRRVRGIPAVVLSWAIASLLSVGTIVFGVSLLPVAFKILPFHIVPTVLATIFALSVRWALATTPQSVEQILEGR